MTEPLADAKATLLRALDQLDQAHTDLTAPPQRADLIVVYSIGAGDGTGAWTEVDGWASTGGPTWLQAALLRRAADQLDDREPVPEDE
jgi:hypothetical protein